MMQIQLTRTIRLSLILLFACVTLVPSGLAAGIEHPVVDLHFDEGTGNVANDSSGNGNNGIITQASFVEGILGKALSFNGADSFVKIEQTNISSSLNETTISTWVKVDSFPAEMAGIVTKMGRNPVVTGEYFGIWFDGKYIPQTICAGKNEVNQYPNLVRNHVEMNTWTFITWVLSPSTGSQKLYINGELAKEARSYDAVKKSDLPIIIGADISTYERYPTYPTTEPYYRYYHDVVTQQAYETRNYYRFFKGSIDEVRMYDRSLTDSEVKTLYLVYTNPIKPPVPAITPSERVSRIYPMGFEGLSFNADGKKTLDLDLAKAEGAGAVVTRYTDRVEIYQHGSPGVLITFWGDRFEERGGRIKGTVRTAEFITDPLEAKLNLGDVSGSVRAVLPALTQRAEINNTINGQVTPDLKDQFRALYEQNNFQIESIAYTFDVRRANLAATGPANVTLSLPATWVNQHGGKESVRISRISDTTGTAELMLTVYSGTDAKGNMIFYGDSPNGSSVFGMITAKAAAIREQEHPDVTIQPLQKPAIDTDIGMFAWLLGMMRDNPVIIILVIAVLGVAVYVGWYRPHLKQ
jgi:hypothetical protein